MKDRPTLKCISFDLDIGPDTDSEALAEGLTIELQDLGVLHVLTSHLIYKLPPGAPGRKPTLLMIVWAGAVPLGPAPCPGCHTLNTHEPVLPPPV